MKESEIEKKYQIKKLYQVKKTTIKRIETKSDSLEN
jgi:hypothetical protein